MGWSQAVNSALNRGRTARDFLAGTIMVFKQATAPIGWTRLTTNDDSLIRINGSAALGSGGTNGFTATFNSQIQTGSASKSGVTTATNSTGTASVGSTTVASTSGSTTLTTSTMASHTHTYFASSGSQKASGNCLGDSNVGAGTTGSNGSDGSHNHSVPSLTVNNFTAGPLSIPALTVNAFTTGPLSFTTGIKYVDVLAASKN